MLRRKRRPMVYRTHIWPWIHQWNAKIHLDMCSSLQLRARGHVIGYQKGVGASKREQGAAQRWWTCSSSCKRSPMTILLRTPDLTHRRKRSTSQHDESLPCVSSSGGMRCRPISIFEKLDSKMELNWRRINRITIQGQLSAAVYWMVILLP